MKRKLWAIALMLGMVLGSMTALAASSRTGVMEANSANIDLRVIDRTTIHTSEKESHYYFRDMNGRRLTADFFRKYKIEADFLREDDSNNELLEFLEIRTDRNGVQYLAVLPVWSCRNGGTDRVFYKLNCRLRDSGSLVARYSDYMMVQYYSETHSGTGGYVYTPDDDSGSSEIFDDYDLEDAVG